MSAAEQENIVALIAALVAGDRWISAESCAVFLGCIKKRTFLEKIACLPDFPEPSRVLSTTKLWKKSEVDAWAERHRRKVNQAA